LRVPFTRDAALTRRRDRADDETLIPATREAQRHTCIVSLRSADDPSLVLVGLDLLRVLVGCCPGEAECMRVIAVEVPGC
jgi:hypothetical protein